MHPDDLTSVRATTQTAPRERADFYDPQSIRSLSPPPFRSRGANSSMVGRPSCSRPRRPAPCTRPRTTRPLQPILRRPRALRSPKPAGKNPAKPERAGAKKNPAAKSPPRTAPSAQDPCGSARHRSPRRAWPPGPRLCSPVLRCHARHNAPRRREFPDPRSRQRRKVHRHVLPLPGILEPLPPTVFFVPRIAFDVALRHQRLFFRAASPRDECAARVPDTAPA